jgi:D-alanine-D-alanine ligase-like ATP-grasp enzyme
MRVRECEECGSGAIPHGVTYYSIVIDEFIRALFPLPRGANPITRAMQRVERRLTPTLMRAFVAAGLAKRVTEPDDDTQLLARMLWNEGKERGIRMEEFRLFNLPRNIFLAHLPDGRELAFEGIPLTEAEIDRVHWMDDKAELKKRFRKLGLPVAKGGDAITLGDARRIFKTLAPPAIAKPFSGSASRHTTLHIMDDADLVRAFRIAKAVAPRVVIEEELTGAVYRATVVDGTFAAALRRDQPYVTGDGARTVRELVAEANMHPARGGPYFHPIKLDAAAEAELRWQGLSTESVPAQGRRVTLHQKINWSVGGTTADVTDEVHPDNIALFEEVARVLKAPIAGIDFIIGDIGRSWKEQERCGILETNSMPFFDNHHLPFEGKPRNVAALIWDMNGA